MKNSFFTQTITLVILLYSINVFACQCTISNIDKSFLTSDFVAQIKILKKYENKLDSNFYEADIEIIDLYKGKAVESILIYGNYKSKQDSACWIYTEENENLLVYANFDTNNATILNACSRIRFLDKIIFTRKHEEYNKQKIFDRELEILTVLKNNKIDYSNSGKIHFDMSCFLRLMAVDFNNKKSEEKIDEFGIFGFTIGKNLKVKKVLVIKGFSKKINRKIKKIIKQQKWPKAFTNNTIIKKGTKSFVTINYKSNSDNYKYFRAISM